MSGLSLYLNWMPILLKSFSSPSRIIFNLQCAAQTVPLPGSLLRFLPCFPPVYSLPGHPLNAIVLCCPDLVHSSTPTSISSLREIAQLSYLCITTLVSLGMLFKMGFKATESSVIFHTHWNVNHFDLNVWETAYSLAIGSTQYSVEKDTDEEEESRWPGPSRQYGHAQQWSKIRLINLE